MRVKKNGIAWRWRTQRNTSKKNACCREGMGVGVEWLRRWWRGDSRTACQLERTQIWSLAFALARFAYSVINCPLCFVSFLGGLELGVDGNFVTWVCSWVRSSSLGILVYEILLPWEMGSALSIQVIWDKEGFTTFAVSIEIQTLVLTCKEFCWINWFLGVHCLLLCLICVT